MSEEELPPWMALPEEVRHRVSERFKEIFPEKPHGDVEKQRRELSDLGVFRLTEAHHGDIPKAIAFARCSPQGRHLLKVIGDKKSDWVAAIARCQEVINQILGDENQLLQALVMQQLVIEELKSYRNRNG